MNRAEQLQLRDKVTKEYKSGNFEKGDSILANNSERLSEAIASECRGNKYFYLEEHQKAINEFEKGIRYDPEHKSSRHYYLVGTIEEKYGDLSSAFIRYQDAIELDQSFADAYVAIGGILFHIGEYDGAVKALEDARELEPFNLVILDNLRLTLDKLISKETFFSKRWRTLKKIRSELK